MFRRSLTLACLLGLSLSAIAQADADLTQRLLQRIDALEKRVAELEGRSRTPAAVASDKPAAPREFGAPMPGAQDHAGHPQMPAAQTAGSDQIGPSLSLRGFADLNFSATNQNGAKSGFQFGEFVLHFSSKLSKKISAFAEIAVEAQPEGFSIDLERALIRYDINDSAKVSFGRYHTPINYWNTAYHHGFWLQTTISRPRMVDFDGPYLPAHFVGLQIEGNPPSGPLGLGYNIGLGNGRGVNLPSPGQAGDVNNNRALVLNVYSRPAGVRGLQIGASLYHDRIFPGAPSGDASPTIASALRAAADQVPVLVPLVPGRDYDELIASAHAVYITEGPEFLAEFANIRHRDAGRDFNSPGFYLQAAYRLPFRDRRVKPYYRYEYIRSPLGDPVFLRVARETNFRLHTAGLRYDISDFAAFKFEYRHEFDPSRINNIGPLRFDGAFAQTSFTF